MGDRTKEQLIEEIESLRQVVAALKQEKTQREQAEEALRESEQERAAILNTMSEHVVYRDLGMRVLWANRAAAQSVGLAPEQLVGRHCYEIWHQRSKPCVVCPVKQSLETGQPQEAEITTPDGRIWWIRAYPIRDANGDIISMANITLEITERKRAEEKLKGSEERYRSLVNNIRLGIFRNTPGPIGKFLEVNPAMEEITGYSRGELLEMNVSDLYERPQERRAFSEEIAAVVGKTITKELSFRRKDGTQIVVSDTTVAVRDNAGQVVWFDGILEDITERKQAEERVQHLNVVLRAIRSVNQVIARETDRSQLLKGICRSLTETRGYYNAWIALLDESGKLGEYAESGLGDDFLPMKERLERGELTHCARRALEQFSPIMTENPPVNCSDCPLSGNYKGRGALTTRLQHGATCYGIMSLSTPAELLGDDEEVVLCREIADDIVFALGSLELEERRRKAAEELEESEERYRALVEAGADMGEAIGLLQNTDKVEAAHLFANDGWVRITGYTPEELREISYFDLVHPRYRDAAADRNRRRLRGEDVPGPWEISIVGKDGAEVPVEGIGTPITYEGRPAVVGYIRDITERKNREERLVRLSNAVRMSTDSIVMSDLEGKIIEANEATLKMYGVDDKGDVIGKNSFDLIAPEDREKAFAGMEEVRKRGYSRGWEYRIMSKDGREIPVEMDVAIMKDVEGKAVGFVAVSRDITERKRAEEEQAKVKATLHSLNAAALAVQRTLAPGDIFSTAAGELRKLGFLTTIFSLDEDQSNLMIAHTSFSPELIKAAEKLTGLRLSNIRFPLDRIPQYIKEVFGNRVTVFSQDKERIEGFLPAHLKGLAGKLVEIFGLQKGIIAPLVVEGKVIGALAVDSKELAEKDVAAVTAFANQVSIAIENTRLYKAAQQELADRKRAEKEIEQQRNYFQALFDGSPEAVASLDAQNRVVGINPAFEKIFGYTSEDIKGKDIDDCIVPRSRKEEGRSFSRRAYGGEVVVAESIRKRADGREIPVSILATPITINGKREGMFAIYRDITEWKRAEEKLKASLEEKEILLKEIHHRVKNNLQVISSLLKLQSGYIEDERYAEMFKDSQERVKSMALVHEKLYQSEDLARIDFAGYIESVVEELRRAYGAETAGIGIKIEVEDIRLGVDQAIPCGLIINELVSNSLKHAFPEGEGGEIRIAMRQVGEDEVELEVSDNGIGLPESVEIRNAKSLGLHLVSMLAEDQLVGGIKLDRTKGTRFRIRFRVRE